ncbi:MAG: hypothetical protein Q8M26_14495 [Pseudolabrys sp.]|nr:hypothetical protein [Pseudolabrys sp.]
MCYRAQMPSWASAASTSTSFITQTASRTLHPRPHAIQQGQDRRIPWRGPPKTSVAGIQILRPNNLKLFREHRKPVLRGTALKLDRRNAFLWNSGYVPQLLTYPGREVLTPLKIRIVFGDSEIEQVVADILALTKLNFNACIFGDGLPVTLRFADDIGEILIAIQEVTSKPLIFRHYI